MASVGHVIVGAFAGRVFAGQQASKRQTIGAVVAFAALALLPDIDVAWVALGSPDHGIGGHRGFTHTFGFSVCVAAIAAWIVGSKVNAATARTLAFVFATLASHGILDALTFDSRGVMLFWPVSDVTVAFAWRPIPSAPTGLAFVGLRGLEVALVEILFFAPALAATVRPPRSFAAIRSPLLAVAGIASLVVCSLFFAEIVWRNVSIVSQLEASSAREIAVREQHRLRAR